MLIYHVTHVQNVSSIEASGINPDFSVGKTRACWYVTRRRLNWAISHICQRKKVWPDQLVVYSVYVNPSRLIRTSISGIYRISGTIKTTRPHTPAMRYIGEAVDV
jgi:hypothetical protein